VVCLGIMAQDYDTVDQLVAFIRSASNAKQDDPRCLHTSESHLSKRLEDRTVEELQALGAGAKTVAALHILRDSERQSSPCACAAGTC